MDDLKIERRGGIAGMGGPGGRLSSTGSLSLSSLPPEDQRSLRNLFDTTSGRPKAHMPDGFTYRITWTGPSGKKVIDLSEEAAPPAIRDCVVDRLK